MTDTRAAHAARPGLLVVGSAPGCGKTTVAAGVLQRLNRHGLRVAGMKPVALGCAQSAQGPRDPDALQLQAMTSPPTPDYDHVNPLTFQDGTSGDIEPAPLQAAFDILAGNADLVVAEGIGDWGAADGPGYAAQTVARVLSLPVVLVVGLGPDSVERAASGARAAHEAGHPLAGWIANTVDPDLRRVGALLQSLRQCLYDVPCLGVIDHHRPATPEAVARHLRPDRLLGAAGCGASAAGNDHPAAPGNGAPGRE